jgi:hypothetical protein
MNYPSLHPGRSIRRPKGLQISLAILLGSRLAVQFHDLIRAGSIPLRRNFVVKGSHLWYQTDLQKTSSPFQPVSCSIRPFHGVSMQRRSKRAPPSPRRWRSPTDLGPLAALAVDLPVQPALHFQMGPRESKASPCQPGTASTRPCGPQSEPPARPKRVPADPKQVPTDAERVPAMRHMPSFPRPLL